MAAYRPRTTKPSAAGDVLERTLKGLHLKKKLQQYEWFSRWPDLVGEEIAAVSYPERLQGGKILVVKVLDVAWAQELSLRKQELLDKLYEAEIGVSVEDMRFKTGDPKEFEQRLERLKE